MTVFKITRVIVVVGSSLQTMKFFLYSTLVLQVVVGQRKLIGWLAVLVQAVRGLVSLVLAVISPVW